MAKLPHGLQLAVGPGSAWHDAGEPKVQPSTPHAFASRKILTAPTSAELATDEGEPPWRYMFDRALAVLANGAQLPGCDGLELRLVAVPEEGRATRLDLFVTAMARGWGMLVAETAVEAACAQLPAGFTTERPREDLPYGQAAGVDDAIAIELRRSEFVSYPSWDFIPADFYYTLRDAHGDGSGWASFWKVLASVREPVTVSLLFARTALAPLERAVIGDVLTDLTRYAEVRTEYDFMGQPVTYPACAEAGRVLASWQERVATLDRPLLARLAVRGASPATVTVATALAAAVTRRADSSSSAPLELAHARSETDRQRAAFSFNWMEVVPWGGHDLWQDDRAPLTLRRLPYLFGLHEAAGLLALPVPDKDGVPGVPRSRRSSTKRETIDTSEPRADAILLGRRMHYGEAGAPLHLPLSALNRHALVVGSSGTGKTTAILSLLARLWREQGIPFLVLESVKTEYRSLLDVPAMDALKVVTLGNERVSPIRLNLLAPPPGVRAEKHQGSVMAALKLALPLFPPQPQILAKALARTYDQAGWDDDTTIGDGIAPPSLRDLLRVYREVFDAIGYRGEALNIGLGFQARLESLLTGARGKLLDTVTSTNFEQLLDGPLVVEMNDIADPEDRAILAALLLQRVRAAAEARGSSDGHLKHVTVIEEAHRLLGSPDGTTTTGGSEDRSRADSVAAFCEAIAELRSYGEGFVLSSQSPAKLAPAAISSTSTRVVLRLEGGADRRSMLEDLDAQPDLSGIAARLGRGEALVRWSELDDAELVALEPDNAVDSGKPLLDDRVASAMAETRAETGRLLPHPLCSPDVCTTGCVPAVRRGGHRLADRLGPRAGERWRESPTTAVDEIASWLCSAAEGNSQVAYCGAAHLSAESVALIHTPGVDRRPVLITAIREAARRER